MKEFYRETLDTLAGRSASEWFKSNYGICLNYEQYLLAKGIDQEALEKLCNLRAEFKAAGLNEFTPFNSGKTKSFAEEAATKTLYQNPARLQWIEDHAR